MIKKLFLNDRFILGLILLNALLLIVGGYLQTDFERQFFSIADNLITTLLISLYSTFKIFTVEGWFEIPEQIVENYSKSASFFTYLYFIFVVLSGGIFGLSLVNSIFVDSMVSDNNDELEKKIDNLDSKIIEILTKIKDNETGNNSGQC